MFGKRTKTTEICAFTKLKNQAFLSVSDPEGLRWGQSGVRIFGQNGVIVENGLSKNDDYEREISGFQQHIFLNGIFCLMDRRLFLEHTLTHVYFLRTHSNTSFYLQYPGTAPESK